MATQETTLREGKCNKCGQEFDSLDLEWDEGDTITTGHVSMDDATVVCDGVIQQTSTVVVPAGWHVELSIKDGPVLRPDRHENGLMAHPIWTMATCEKCGEDFCPDVDECLRVGKINMWVTTHYVNESGEECNGIGVVYGQSVDAPHLPNPYYAERIGD